MILLFQTPSLKTLSKFYEYFPGLPSMPRLIHVYASLQTLMNMLITHSTQLLFPVNAAERLGYCIKTQINSIKW